MMSIEIKVNGRPVAVIEAYNDGIDGLHGLKVADYPYRGFAFSQNFDGPTTEEFRGTVRGHKYDAGILELSRRMLECICEG